MRAASLSFATVSVLLLASAGQAPANPSAASASAGTRVVFGMSPDRLAGAQARSCPVSLDVRRGASMGQVVATGRVAGGAEPQALDVTVTNLGSSEITSLDVVVQLRAAKSGMVPLLSESEALGERLPLHIDLSVKAEKDVATSWGVASTHPVAYVAISRVTYRDGSSWAAAKSEACQFKLNPVMLISSR